jgi:chromosome segregation ATPase
LRCFIEINRNHPAITREEIRAELAKNLESVVRQEIKDHNDAITANNTAMGALRQELADHKEQTEKHIGVLVSDFGKMNTRIQQIQEKQEEMIAQMRRELNDSLKQMGEFQEKISGFMIVLKNSYVKKEVFDASIRILDDDLDDTSRTLSHLTTDVREGIQRISSDYKEKIDKAKNDILNKPSEAKAVKQELLKEIDYHKVNSEGVKEELNSMKQSLFISSKYIEDLYNQLDRIKKEYGFSYVWR